MIRMKIVEYCLLVFRYCVNLQITKQGKVGCAEGVYTDVLVITVSDCNWWRPLGTADGIERLRVLSSFLGHSARDEMPVENK